MNESTSPLAVRALEALCATLKECGYTREKIIHFLGRLQGEGGLDLDPITELRVTAALRSQRSVLGNPTQSFKVKAFFALCSGLWAHGGFPAPRRIESITAFLRDLREEGAVDLLKLFQTLEM